MMTVVYVVDDLNLGGAQRQLVELVQALPRDRYDVHIISLSATKRAYVGALRAGKIPVTCIAQSGKWSWRTFIQLYRVIRRLRPAVVHTGLFTADLYGRLAARLAGVRVVVSTVHSVDFDKPSRHVMADRLLRGLTDRFIATAGAVRTVLNEREGVPPERTTVIYNGVNLREFTPASSNGHLRAELGLPAEDPVIGIVGRLVPVKDHETFLYAAALVRQAMPRSRFLIVGDGARRAPLEHLIDQLDLRGHVRFLGSRSEVAPVYDLLDLLVVSSRYEGCCRVILEAMAMSKPVVATAVGGNPELVSSGRTGLLVPPEDPRHLADAILELLDHPDRARAMGRSARHRVEQRFSLERMVEETDRVYQELLEP
ncbi:MAG: glycosyltransferase [Candidatus Omnitrophica bacterium]|nr:glycosyltransferase [Candidatus Omnitrophota bacterium]